MISEVGGYPMTNDMAFWPATRLLAEIQKGVVGAQEALEHFWARVEKYNPSLNAIVAYDIDAARQRPDFSRYMVAN